MALCMMDTVVVIGGGMGEVSIAAATSSGGNVDILLEACGLW